MNTTQTPNPGRFQTRGVLGAAYKSAAAMARSMLTHLVDNSKPGEAALCSRAVNICDAGAYTDAELASRPTCSKCGPKWDSLHVSK